MIKQKTNINTYISILTQNLHCMEMFITYEETTYYLKSAALNCKASKQTALHSHMRPVDLFLHCSPNIRLRAHFSSREGPPPLGFSIISRFSHNYVSMFLRQIRKTNLVHHGVMLEAIPPSPWQLLKPRHWPRTPLHHAQGNVPNTAKKKTAKEKMKSTTKINAHL